ncbi:putative leucine-rich repeat domain superfamily [Helianthus debilis subsp. tardiflorus]
MDFSSLSMLKELNLDGNPIDAMPDCVGSLSRLKTLTFIRCANFKTALCAPILLKYLFVDNFPSLEKISFHPETSSLPYLRMFLNLALTDLQYNFKFQAISEIDGD